MNFNKNDGTDLELYISHILTLKSQSQLLNVHFVWVPNNPKKSVIKEQIYLLVNTVN